MRHRHVPTFLALLLIALVTSAETVYADIIFTVDVNTAPLGGLVGPFAVAFQLNDGSGSADGNNTATITSFAFSGGSAAGCPANCTTTGGASGDMTGTVTLTDSDFLNSFAERFTPGSSLSFQVDLTTNVDAGGVPDAFAFSILDNGVPIPTLDGLGTDSLLTVDIDSSDPSVLTYGTDSSRTTISLDAPVIGAAPSAVPEPSTLLLVVTGLAGVAGMARRRLKK